MTPETAFLEAIQAALLASDAVTALVGEKVFDEVPSDGSPPLIFVGPISRQRANDPAGNAAWTLRARIYAESTGFGRREAWEIANAAGDALEGAELSLADPFQAVDIVRTIQGGDVFDDQGRFKTVFLDVGTTVQRLEG